MSASFHSPPEDIEPIYRWYKKAQVDYIEQFIRLYIAYNAWYREVTASSSDREALSQLKKRIIIWKDYADGYTLQSMKPYAEKLAEFTQREPLGKTIYWEGYVHNSTDWKSIIEFWYQIRCQIVHGSNVRKIYVWLAYETLNAFMSEIIDRMQAILDNVDWSPSSAGIDHMSDELKVGNTSTQADIQRFIHQKYVTSPDIWQVDMQRV